MIGNSFRLGSILGFEIRIDFSWFIIAFLILWSFSFAAFPTAYPELEQWVYFAMGAAATFLFFASLLGHEMAHSVVARKRGIPVEGITLFLFGGMAHMRTEAERPGDELAIAGVGPLFSLALALLFGLIWWVGNTAGWPVFLTGVAGYLGFLNLLLAVFNLLPGFPLDGGRVFRSMVWMYTGDFTRATRVASSGGRYLGLGLIALGIWSVFAGNVLGGLWFVLIGWFLRNAAAMTYEQHLVRGVLQRVHACEAMTRNPETVSPDLTLRELVDDYFLHRRHQAFPVAENDRPLGIITLRQVKGVQRDDWPRRTVRDTMTELGEDIVVAPNDSLNHVLEKLEHSEVRRVLVSRSGHLEGLITASDVSGWLDRTRQLDG